MLQSQKQRVLEVLNWVKDMGLWPEKFRLGDRFVIQISNKLTIRKYVTKSQRRLALWVPTPEVLRDILAERGFECELVEGSLEGMRWISFRGEDESIIGCGPDREMATIDALLMLRDKWSIVGVT